MWPVAHIAHVSLLQMTRVQAPKPLAHISNLHGAILKLYKLIENGQSKLLMKEGLFHNRKYIKLFYNYGGSHMSKVYTLLLFVISFQIKAPWNASLICIACIKYPL